MKAILLKPMIVVGLLCPLVMFGGEGGQSIVEPREEGGCCGSLFDRYPPVYNFASPHWLAAISAQADSVELEDGSAWKISTYDGYKVLNWRSNDPLLITQNTRWFSKYKFRIINQNTGSSLEANLYLASLKNSPYARYITVLDPTYGDLQLSDGTHWEVSPFDRSIFLNWALSDFIFTGYNSGWDSSYEAILINFNTGDFVRAKQF